VLVVAFQIVLCSYPAQAQDSGEALSGRLVIAGSNTMVSLVAQIAKRFQQEHPSVEVSIQGGGSGRGLNDVRAGKADIGMVAKALGDSDRDLQDLPIARDGVVLIVHRDNPVHDLTDRQIAELFSGGLANWKLVGGRDAPVIAIAPTPGRSSTEFFSHYFRLPPDRIKAQRFGEDNLIRIRMVADDPNAISFVSVGEAERAVRAGVALRLLSLGGAAATSQNIRNGSYPISRPLALVTLGAPSGVTKAFIQYCNSSVVTDLVIAHDFVPYLD
jgi:phosphate transport system substrate-binding protein